MHLNVSVCLCVRTVRTTIFNIITVDLDISRGGSA